MDIKSIFEEVASELEEEKTGQMSTSDRRLHAVAQRLLVLERDLRAPGAARSRDERVDRLLEAIARESF